MLTPRRHLSVDELTQRASTGSAIRRGEIKISDPIPSSYVHNGADMDRPYEQSVSRPIVSGGREPSDATADGRNISNLPAHVSKFTERASLGPSTTDSNGLSANSREVGVQRKNTGLRASIRRMFSSRHDRNTNSRFVQSSEAPDSIFSMTGPQTDHLPAHTHLDHTLTSRALHSHAPPPHQRVESESVLCPELEKRRTDLRRNTLPTLTLIAPEEIINTRSRLLEGRTPPRPTTAVKQPGSLVVQHNRRSRSAEGLRDIAHLAEKPKKTRDRSEEIAFWRNSVIMDPLPQLSRVQNDSAHRDTQAVHEAVPRPSIEPIQEFDFGLSKIPVPSAPSTLLERVNTIEVKLYDFEFALTKLQGTEIDHCGAKCSTDVSNYVNRVSSGTDTNSAEPRSFTQSKDVRQRPYVRSRGSLDRNSKATTIKASAQRTPSDRSQTPSTSSMKFSGERYSYLYDLVQEERVARQQLEAQIINLQKEVDILKSPVYTYAQQTYPTPSPDSLHNPSSLRTPKGARQSLQCRREQDFNETSRFSMTETDSDDDTNDFQPEIYKTPQQDTFHFETRRLIHAPMI